MPTFQDLIDRLWEDYARAENPWSRQLIRSRIDVLRKEAEAPTT